MGAKFEICKSFKKKTSNSIENMICWIVITIVIIICLVNCQSFQYTKYIGSNVKSSEFSLFAIANTRYVTTYEEIKCQTLNGIHLSNITPQIKESIRKSGVIEGVVTVISRHTTAAITINELENRLVDDTRQFLLKLVPPSYPYLHNDLHLRDGPLDWPGGNEAWRAQEPVNVINQKTFYLFIQFITKFYLGSFSFNCNVAWYHGVHTNP
jgi:hypothetical protein